MIFVPTDELKPGMRLAKPIYNRNGVMLYERDTKLPAQGINSIKNFGLIGIYVLEPAEPLPPMTEEDREFERFQTVAVFSIKEIMVEILKGKSSAKIESLVTEIIKNYGRNAGKIAFAQNLRSAEDNVFKHSVNVAILAAAICSKLNISASSQHAIVVAALLHDIGCLSIPLQVVHKSAKIYTEQDLNLINKCRDDGYRVIRENCDFDSEIMKNISYLHKAIRGGADDKTSDREVDVLKVAYYYDVLTAMKFGEEPQSDIWAYKYLIDPKNGMNKAVVAALAKAINIVPVGCSVQFVNGDKGIVLTENEYDILRPFVLSFRDNMIYNLIEDSVYREYQIKDVLKTMDNRHIMTDEFKKYQSMLGSGQVK